MDNVFDHNPYKTVKEMFQIFLAAVQKSLYYIAYFSMDSIFNSHMGLNQWKIMTVNVLIMD